jgi:phosphatidylserine decarboxylase
MYLEQFLRKSKWVVFILFLILYFTQQSGIKYISIFIGLVIIYMLYVINQQPTLPEFNPGEVISPASGYIGHIEKIEDGKTLVMMNLSFLSNHIQYIPYPGQIISDQHFQAKDYTGQKRMFTLHPTIQENFQESIYKNEQYQTTLRTEIGDFEIVRIAGIVAPRVYSFIKEGEYVERGEVMGVILFSSMVLFILPPGIEPLVKKGDSVLAGTTIIAKNDF